MKPAPIEIRCPVHGPIEVSSDEIKIIDSPYFQRLRGIKQMGFAELAFPSATHNRYAHSLGAFHIAGKVFEQLFQDFEWGSKEEEIRIRYTLRMAALLHDVGHGPLSHAVEQAMPLKKDVTGSGEGQATHEDYTEAILLRSSMTPLLQKTFSKDAPEAIAGLIRGKTSKPDYFKVGKSPVNVLPALSSVISGELDVDRMDYMARDSMQCGIAYGQYDRNWIFSNLLLHRTNGDMYLAIDSRAIYAIEDFLLSRYHMYLMVYLHHKAVVYDEMLFQFLKSDDTTKIPSSIEEYLHVDDYWLQSRLRKSDNEWAKRITDQKPYRMLLELHSDQTPEAQAYANELEQKLRAEKIPFFRSSSTGLLSKYTNAEFRQKNFPLYVIYRDPRFTSGHRPGIRSETLAESTELFSRYQKKRIIDRIYAAA